MLTHLLDRIHRFYREARGTAAVIFGIAAIPTFMILGMAIDYGIGINDKTKLDAAADAASLVGITTAKTIITAQNGSLTSPIDALAAGKAQALTAFAANAGNIAFGAVPTPTASVTNSGQTITATVNYAMPMANQFGKIIGIPTTNIGGSSTSTLTIGSYLDFYLMVDMSGSMGLPTLSSDQTRLASVNPDNIDANGGCIFACHMQDSVCSEPASPPTHKSAYTGPCQGFQMSRNYNIVLRVDSVTSAVCQFLAYAVNQETLTNQFRVGIYPFITSVGQFFPTNTSTPTSSDLIGDASSAATTVGCSAAPTLYSQPSVTSPIPPLTNLVDIGSQSTLGSGGTHLDAALPAVAALVSPNGKGATPAQAAPYIFLITDGMDNEQIYNTSGFHNGSTPQNININTANCQAIQNSGVVISILYIPYVVINPVDTSGGNGPEQTAANNAIPTDPAKLQSCASPGFFHTANSSTDIATALKQMLNQAIQAARISQ